MIIAFTGAGISKESGIDTFQDRQGIREKLTRSYACRHPENYKGVMREFVANIEGKEPNDAHIVLAEYEIPILTMNVDMLHEMAGSKCVIKMHGRLPDENELDICNTLYNTPVLYGDPAPMYAKAYDVIDILRTGDILLIIGASDYTDVARQFRKYARIHGARVHEIQSNASVEVRNFLENHKEYMGSISEVEDRIKDMYSNP